MNETPLIVNLVILVISLIFVPILIFKNRKYFKSKLSIILFILLFLYFFFNLGCASIELSQEPMWVNRHISNNCTCWEFSKRINLTNLFSSMDWGWSSLPYTIHLTFGANKPYCNDGNSDGDLLDNGTDYLSLRVIKDIKDASTSYCGSGKIKGGTLDVGFWEVAFEVNNPVCVNNQLYSGDLVFYPHVYQNETDCGYGTGTASYLIVYSNTSRVYPTFDLGLLTSGITATPTLTQSGSMYISNYTVNKTDSLTFDKTKGYIDEYWYGDNYLTQVAPRTGFLKIYNTSGYYIFSDDLQEIIHTGDVGGSSIDFSGNYTLHNVTLIEDSTITKISFVVANEGTSDFSFRIFNSFCGNSPSTCLSATPVTTATLSSANVKNGTNYVDITDFSASKGNVLWIMTGITSGGTQIGTWLGDNVRTQEINSPGTNWIYQDTLTPSVRLVKSAANDACSISSNSQLRKEWNCTSGNGEGWIKVSREYFAPSFSSSDRGIVTGWAYVKITTKLNQNYYFELDSFVQPFVSIPGTFEGYLTLWEYEGYTPLTSGTGGLGDAKYCGSSSSGTINQGWILESNYSAATYLIWNESVANQFVIRNYCEGGDGENYTQKIIGPVSANQEFSVIFMPMTNLSAYGVDFWRDLMKPPSFVIGSEESYNCNQNCSAWGSSGGYYCNFQTCIPYDQDLDSTYCRNTTTNTWMNNSRCCGDDTGEDFGDGILNCCCNGAFLANKGKCDQNQDGVYDGYCDMGTYVCPNGFVDSNKDLKVDPQDACACEGKYNGYYCDSDLNKIFDGVCVETSCCNTTAVDKNADGVADFCGDCGSAGASGVPCADMLPTKMLGKKCDPTDNMCIPCSSDGTEGFGYEDLICELACGAIKECDEVAMGTKLGKCDYYGKTYFEDACCGDNEYTSVCRSSKFHVNCTANINCEGLAPNSCPNKEYFCSYMCTYEDRDYLKDYCESKGSGCTPYTWVGSKCCGDDGVNDDYTFTDGICFNGEVYYCGIEDDVCPGDLNTTCLTEDFDCTGLRPGLLDVGINLLKDTYNPGEELAFDIKLTAYGEEEIKTEIEYWVLRDSETLKSEKETVNVKNEIVLSRKILLPEELKQGDYSLLINISYDNKKLSETKKFYILLDCVDILPKEFYLIAEIEQDIKLKVINKCEFALEDYTLLIPEFNNLTKHLEKIETSEDVWVRSSPIPEGTYSFNVSSSYKNGKSLSLLNIIFTAPQEVIDKVTATFNGIKDLIKIAKASLAGLFLFTEDKEKYLENIDLVSELLETADDEIALKKYSEAQVTIAIANEIISSLKQEIDIIVNKQNQIVFFALIGVVIILASIVTIRIYTMGKLKKPPSEEEVEV